MVKKNYQVMLLETKILFLEAWQLCDISPIVCIICDELAAFLCLLIKEAYKGFFCVTLCVMLYPFTSLNNHLVQAIQLSLLLLFW